MTHHLLFLCDDLCWAGGILVMLDAFLVRTRTKAELATGIPTSAPWLQRLAMLWLKPSRGDAALLGTTSKKLLRSTESRKAGAGLNDLMA